MSPQPPETLSPIARKYETHVYYTVVGGPDAPQGETEMFVDEQGGVWARICHQNDLPHYTDGTEED